MICDDRTPEERTSFLMDRVRHLCAQSAISGRMPTDLEVKELRDDVLIAFNKAEKRGAVKLQDLTGA